MTCVVCGAEIPEGRQVCPKCEMEYAEAIQFAREFMSDDVHELAKIFRTENGTGHSD